MCPITWTLTKLAYLDRIPQDTVTCIVRALRGPMQQGDRETMTDNDWGSGKWRNNEQYRMKDDMSLALLAVDLSKCKCV